MSVSTLLPEQPASFDVAAASNRVAAPAEPGFLDHLRPVSSGDSSTATESPRTVHLWKAFDQFQAHRDGWRQLCDRSGGAIEQFEWVGTCLGESRQSIFALREGDALTAAAPLVLQRSRGVTRAVMAGVADHYEPMEFLGRGPGDLDALCTAIASSGRPLMCGRVPADSPTIASLKKAYDGRGVVRIREEAPTPWIALDDSWTDPETHLNSGRRSDLRRARKRAEELGAITVEILTPDVAALPALLNEAFEIESRSWKGEEQTALACDEKRGAFFRRYADAACREGTLRLCFLRVGGKAIAMQIAVEQSRRFWLLKVGYDAAFSRCSPGMLMTRETIAHAAKQKMLSYEFLGTCAPWTDVWTNQKRQCVSLVAYPWAVGGLAALAVDSAASVAAKSHKLTITAVKSSLTAFRGAVKAVVDRAARNYVAGETLADALRVRDNLHAEGKQTTLGFWDGEGDSPKEVADRYLAALNAMTGDPRGAYLSIKLPSLDYSADLLEQVAAKAESAGCRLHFDALGPEAVDRTQSAIDKLRQKFPCLSIGYTLPGRWTRSVTDADWAAARGLAIRIVKGQWADPTAPNRDPRAGFLEVAQRLAGHVARVNVATHDEALAAEASTILEAGGTRCDRCLLYGMVQDSAVRAANRRGQTVRVYIPYGAAYLPYAVSRLRKNPGVACRLAWDWVKSLFSRG